MFIVMPSDPTTENASVFLTERDVAHRIIPIPESLGYKTSANIGIYIPGDDVQQIMLDMSAKGLVIMRVFRQFELDAGSPEAAL